MGESKRRKETEKHYGLMPKDSGKRGIVLSRPMEIEGKSISLKGGLDPQELRFGLLMWDHLVLPESNFMGFAPTDDETFLEGAGILKKARFFFEGDVATGIATGHVQVFRDLDRNQPGMWALAQGDKSFLWKSEETAQGTGSLIELHRAVPIPKHDVPLAEILEFRERRRDELLMLRFQLESFVVEVQNAPDRDAALQLKIKEIDQACADLISVSKEWQFPVYLSDFKTSFSLDPNKFIGAVGAAAAMTYQNYGLTAAAVAAGLVALGSTISVKSDVGFRSIRRPMSPYRYAFQMHEALN